MLSNYLTCVLQFFHKLWSKFALIFKYHNKRCEEIVLVKKNKKIISLPFSEIPKVSGLPLFGTVLHLMAAGGAPKLHKYIDERHKQLGPIFRERLDGKQDFVFVSSADMMRATFLYEGQCPRHPLPNAWILYNTINDCQRGLLFMEGKEWLHNRRLLNRFLLNENLNWMNFYIETCTSKLISSWRNKLIAQNDSESYILIKDLESQLYRWAIDVICCIMFGPLSIAPDSQIDLALTEFSNIVHKIFETSSKLMSFPPKIAKQFKMKIWTDFESSISKVLQQGSEIIDSFVKLSTEINGEEVLFYKLRSADMPLSTIKQIFVDLIIAAGDTTAYTTEWALYLLSNNTELQTKIANEKLNAKNSNVQEVSAVHGLLKETLRLYPVAPFIGRFLSTDAVIGGYNIKKDTLVIISLYTSGREACHFPEPLSVQVDRWTRDDKTGKLKNVLEPHGTLPFAIGNRSCIGRKIATTQMSSILTAIVQNFHLKCLNSTPVDSLLRLVTVPDQPLRLGISLRTE